MMQICVTLCVVASSVTWWNLSSPPGSQIIDLMMLVVDITKGIQTQTAEVSYYRNV